MFGRLLAVTDANYNDIERYYYGPMGRLAAYHEADAGVYYDADLQRFVYHGDHMVAAYLPSDHNGNAWTDAQWEAIWGPSQDQLLTFFDHTHATGTRVLNVMRDHRNSVVGAYDADTDHVVGRAHYNADGRMMTFDTDAAAYATSDIQSVDCQEVGTFDGICEAPGGIPFAFNSMWRSPATGMVYMRNRVYDPRLGQFLSHDPLGYIDSYNLYQFASFDPINRWDPFGLVGGVVVVGGGIGAAAAKGAAALGGTMLLLEAGQQFQEAGKELLGELAETQTDKIENPHLRAAAETYFAMRNAKNGADVLRSGKKIVTHLAEAAKKKGSKPAKAGAKSGSGSRSSGQDPEGPKKDNKKTEDDGPETPDEKTKGEIIKENRESGAQFEDDVLKSLGAKKNTDTVPGVGKTPTGKDKTHIPDIMGQAYGVTDIKDVKKLSNSKQMRAFRKAAEEGTPFNLIVSPKTKTISKPLQDAIRETKGKIFQYDPKTGKWSKVVTDGNKVVR